MNLPANPTEPVEPPSASLPPGTAAQERRRNLLASFVLVLAGIAAGTPALRAEVYGRVGFLLSLVAFLEIAHGFRRSTAAGQRAAWIDGAISLAMGFALVSSSILAASALKIVLAGWCALDGFRRLVAAFRDGKWRKEISWALPAFGNLALAALLLGLDGRALAWLVALAAAFRMADAAARIFRSPAFTADDSAETVIENFDLPAGPELQMLARRIATEETERAAIDRGWIFGFIATLFAIHFGRIGIDRSFLGVLSPFVAVLGDLAIALLLAFFVVIPWGMGWRRASRPLAARAWAWTLAGDPESRGPARRVLRAFLTRRLRTVIRLRQARYSFRVALSRGLQTGLPLAAILAATVPVWGMSWYFDTENWAAGVWNSWAEERTDDWRAVMVAAVRKDEPETPPDRALAVHPPGLEGDFSFLVIGDTGEGDASQHALRAAWLAAVEKPDVKFVVLSSDVVYPTGSMKHYEANFWLPFMGTTKPIYAIPGNHDWYDALEGFVATFFEPAAAKRAIDARIASDGGVSARTAESLIATATRLRAEYRVPVQFQRAPYFQVQTDSFALFALDTGIVKRLDAAQFAWLEAALASARGKTKMAILGHPLYAGGRYQADDNPDFADLHRLLRAHDVAVVMAGDTHDLEYYLEPSPDSRPPALHFVNGGGGAYLSYGTSLAWPAKPAVPDWAIYPARPAVVAKIDATTPPWKRPFWWWTDRWGAWPFSPEWLSAAFDANVAPFFQSFVEIRVEPSKRRLRLIPHGVRGPLRWRDFQASSLPPSSTPDSPAEWIVPMPARP